MTSDIVIRAEGLGKKYIIGHQSTDRSSTFRDVITQNVKNFVRGAKDMAQGKAIVAGDELEEFWALKDVNFEIKRGDVVGIIGRNGAGKSTLLKVLSRITEPTEGRVEIKGRVASLLEVGTGFHTELSGRENVYLNGAILGMTQAEINRKFDEIVDFSGVEKFLDTPVKRYSSGMYVRLAFAVAAHLEPEILIVDEVLAVGDAEFQKKCLGKMQDVAGQGRTVLFVSHNMSAVQSLCERSILLNNGTVSIFDETRLIVSRHLTQQRDQEIKGIAVGKDLHAQFQLQQLAQEAHGIFLDIECSLESLIAQDVTLNMFLQDHLLQPVGALSIGGMGSDSPISLRVGSNVIAIRLSLPRLAAGNYGFEIALRHPDKSPLLSLPNACRFEVIPVPQAGETEVLSLDWGYGALWIPYSLSGKT
jgi:ABC-type polysaccharide/polyol phosphate transport system ATPase subunit